MTVERLFALLEERWRRHRLLDMSDMQLLVKVLASCCALSNLCLLCRGRQGASALLNDDGTLQHVDDLPEVDDVDASGGQIVPRAASKRTPLMEQPQ